VEIRGASALVTGAGRGIGRALSLALAGAGARVTAVARTKAELDSLVAEIERGGGQATAHAADLTRREACDEAVARAVQAHGGLQVLVNNAGVGDFAPVAETSDEAWETIFSTNLTAPFRLTRAALPHLARQGGEIFMISSLAGTNATANLAAYSASKAALDHFSRCLMLEVRHQGIKVTIVAPGSVDTSFGGDRSLRKGPETSWMLQPEDVAQGVLDLLRTRPEAHLSRLEMRPLRPPKRA
jgi:NAD(P)-dependent dehydrogenase (short-subunit alcohol dehydrogenase family)